MMNIQQLRAPIIFPEDVRTFTITHAQNSFAPGIIFAGPKGKVSLSRVGKGHLGNIMSKLFALSWVGESKGELYKQRSL